MLTTFRPQQLEEMKKVPSRTPMFGMLAVQFAISCLELFGPTWVVLSALCTVAIVGLGTVAVRECQERLLWCYLFLTVADTVVHLYLFFTKPIMSVCKLVSTLSCTVLLLLVYKWCSK